MDYGASNGAQQQHHQYASFGGYDPAPPYDAALYVYGQQLHPDAYRPSAYHYQPPQPPPPPGTDHSDRPTHVQIHASEVFNGFIHPAAHREQQRWFSGHSMGLGTTPQPTTVRTVGVIAAPPTKQRRVGGDSAHRGGGRRGRGTFRGGRGKFGYRASSKQNAGAPPLRDRVQGCKGNDGSNQNHHAVADQLPVTATTAVTGSMSVMEPNQGLAQAPALASDQQSMVSSLPILPFAWCDICRVDCNSLQVLEQHKNGKRHKKTLQRIQQIQSRQKLIVGLQAKWAGESELNKNAEVPVLGEVNILFPQMGGEKVVAAGEICAPAFLTGQFREGGEALAFSGTMTSTSMAPRVSEKNIGTTSAVTAVPSEVKTNIHSAAAENLPEAATMEMDHEIGSGVPTQSVTTPTECSKELKAGDEAPASATPDDIEVPAVRMNNSDKRRGTKRKMRYWRDGKRLRKSQARGSRIQERPKDRTRICTLCNITCDTQAVFECHLSGKKHVSRIKRFQGQNTVFRLISARVPPNQPSAPPRDPEPLFYGLKTNEMFQQVVAQDSQSQLQRGQHECNTHTYEVGLHNIDEGYSPLEVSALDSQSQLHREQRESNPPISELEPSPLEVVALDCQSQHWEQQEGNTSTSKEPSPPEVVATDFQFQLHREQHEDNPPTFEEPSSPEFVAMDSQSQLHREQHECNTPTSKQEPSPLEVVAIDSQSQLHRKQHEDKIPTSEEPSSLEVVAMDFQSQLHREQHEGNTPTSKQEPSPPEVVAIDSQSQLHGAQHEGNTYIFEPSLPHPKL